MARKTKKSEPKTLKEILAAPEQEFSLTVPAGRMPPQAIDAEQSVLGCILLDGDAIIRVSDFLRAEDFYRREHHAIYQAMLSLYGKHEQIDILSIGNALKDGDILERVGGNAYLASLVNRVPTPTHAAQYAKIVKRKKVLRDLIDASHYIAELGWSEADNIEEIINNAEQKIFAISQQSLTQDFIPVRATLEEAYERLEKLSQNEGGSIRGVPTGFHDLDEKLSGLQPSDFVIIAARPSVGKTSLALDIARHVALETKKPIGLFSLEMSQDQVVDRLWAAEAGVNLWRIRSGRIRTDSEEFDRLREALDRLSGAPIFIDDAPSPSVLQMRTLARRLQAEHGLSLIIVDYIQLIASHTSAESLVQQVTEISRGLKTMARELNVPVLALSQLSRAVESRTDQRPKLSDLRDSGSLEQDADVVMFIYRDEKANKRDSAQKGIAEILIEKHRNGPTGKVMLRFDEEHARFWSLDKQHSDVNF